MKPHPIEEVVVIRDLALRRPAQSAPPPPGPEPARGEPVEPAEPAEFSPGQLRQLVAILEMSKCPVRPRILLALASGGRTNVGGLAARTRIDQKTLSHHLGHLRAADLVLCEQSGKCKWYEAAAGRVRCERQGPGRFSLILTSRGGGEAVAMSVGDPGFMNATVDSR